MAEHLKPRTVIEFGSGLYSTPFFLSLPSLEQLWTVETDKAWAEKVPTDDPRMHLLTSFPASLGSDLIFIDDGQSLTERMQTIRLVSKQRPKALVVIHDFEQPDYRQTARFDHVVTFDSLVPWTGVMWNADSPNGGEWVHRLAPTGSTL